jgi:endonuclease III
MKKPEIYLEPKARALRIIELLEKEHPDARVALHYSNPLELLVATILSAQSTDETINKVTKTLFKKYTKLEDYANANLKELEQDIHSTGFYHNKAKNLQNSAKMLVEKYNSKVPNTMEELVKLPGVARKTANIVLTNAYGVVAGVAVDTHVRRLAQRLGLTEKDNPDKIEKDLMALAPKDKWMRITDLLIFHGRRVCIAKKPNCAGCVLNKICPSAFTFS